MRTAFRHKSAAAAAVLIALGLAIVSSAAQTGKAPPPELVQYIRETKHQGFADAKIRSQAVEVGWPAATVDEAFVYVRDEKPSQPAAPVIQAASASGRIAASPAPSQSQTPYPGVATPKQTPSVKQPALVRGAPDDYVIGSGDTLQINVWNHVDVSVPVAVVRPDGKITVPLVKDLEVSGLTPIQAEQRITEGLTQFYEDPNVTVVVATINSKSLTRGPDQQDSRGGGYQWPAGPSRSRPVKRTTTGCVRFSSAPCLPKRCCSRIADTAPIGFGSLLASKEHGRTFRRNEIAKTRSASARICIVRGT